jgi:hypothetical protein
MMARSDYLADARDLIASLKREHLDSVADGLASSIEKGATGTEIVMALRWQIAQLDLSKLTQDSRQKAKSLLTCLELLLEH